MPFINERWLGGTMTNFRTIRQRIDYLLELEAAKARGDLERLPKKEAMQKDRELSKLEHRLGGLRNLRRLPEALFIADVRREAIAVKEANSLEIPVIALVDTNCDPDPIDYVIPANDDAIRAIRLLASKIADAVIEGQQMRGVVMAEAEEEAPEAEYSAKFGEPAREAMATGSDGWAEEDESPEDEYDDDEE